VASAAASTAGPPREIRPSVRGQGRAVPPARPPRADPCPGAAAGAAYAGPRPAGGDRGGADRAVAAPGRAAPLRDGDRPARGLHRRLLPVGRRRGRAVARRPQAADPDAHRSARTSERVVAGGDQDSVNQILSSGWARMRSVLPARDDMYAMARRPRRDLLAGLTVAIVALPLALGFGISSGMGAEAGLATAVVAGALAAVFGGSGLQVSGPTGAMTVVLVPIMAQHGASGVLTVGVLAGLVLVALALARA